jgi:hypothetical protein
MEYASLEAFKLSYGKLEYSTVEIAFNALRKPAIIVIDSDPWWFEGMSEEEKNEYREIGKAYHQSGYIRWACQNTLILNRDRS